MDPTSIAKQANSSNDFFLKDLFEIANSEKMVELSLSDKNTYKMNGKTVEETLFFYPLVGIINAVVRNIYQM